MTVIPPPPMVSQNTPSAVVHRLEERTSLSRACLRRVIARYEVNPLVLTLIARVEGGWSGAKVPNKNGTFDLGLMQINSVHLPELAQYGLTEKMIENNDCVNVGVAAWYVRKVTEGVTLKSPQDYFRAIARYHSKVEPYISDYAQSLMSAYRQLELQQFGSR